MRHTFLRASSRLTLALAFSLMTALPAPAAEENAGNVIAARRQAWAEHGERRDLASKSPVFTGDTLTTNPVGRLQVLFRDDSVLMMAPDTSTTVTEYVYGAGKKPAFGLKMAQGVTRLISGRITEADPSAMTVETPHAIVGIQGTDVQISVGNAATGITLVHGSGKALHIFNKITNAVVSLSAGGSGLIIRSNGSTSPSSTPPGQLLGMGLPLDGDQGGATGTNGQTAGTTGTGGAAGQGGTSPVSPTNQQETIATNTVLDPASDQGIVQPGTPTGVPASFSGTYSGALSGSVGGASVSGNAYLGIKDIASTPTVSAVSLYASDKGWAASTGQSLSIYGEGSIATLDADGNFAFRSDGSTTARMSGYGMLPGGYTDVSGGVGGGNLNLSLAGGLAASSQDISLAGSGSRTSETAPGPGGLPPPPAVPANFGGTYSGAVSGTAAGANLSGTFQAGIKNLASSATLSGFSLYASTTANGLRLMNSSQPRALSIYSSADLAALSGDGSFRFRAGKGGAAALSATDLLAGGHVDVNGRTDGGTMNLALGGSLNGETQDVDMSGQGLKSSAGTPGVPPPPPAIPANFSGRYDGALAGALSGTSVTGNFHMGVKDLATAPTVSAVSLYVSEKGWAPGATKALSVYGEGNLAALGGDGSFSFRSDASSAARLNASGLGTGGYATVSGITDGSALTLGVTGATDGTNADVSLAGEGGKTSLTAPALSDLPAPPAIAPSFAGRHEASLAGSIMETPVGGNVYLGVKDIAAAPTISAISLYVSELGWASGATKALSVYGEGNLGPVNADKTFSFMATPTTPAVLAANGLRETGSVAVQGSFTDGNALNLSLAGTLDGESPVAVAGEGGRTSLTAPSLSDLPVPPAITEPDFTGRYAGTLTGEISQFNKGPTPMSALNPTEGTFSAEITRIATLPTVTQMQMNIDPALSGLAIQGSGNVATLDSSGWFSFTAGNLPGSNANISGMGVDSFSSATVIGSTNGNAMTLNWNGTLSDTTTARVTTSGGGTGAKVP